MTEPSAPDVIEIVHHFGGGVYAKETYLKTGQILVQHKHEHAHLSVLSSGKVELQVDDQRSEVIAPACLTIEANKHHGIRALTDVVWFCIHATNCTDPDLVDQVLVVESDPAVIASMLEAAQ